MAERKTILVVEDDTELRDVYKEILLESFDVDTAINGPECLEKAAQKVYDLIILDIVMPKMNGIEVLSKLRGSGVQSKILMCTNLPHASVIKEAMDLGATDYILKSNLNPGEVLKKVEQILST